MGNLLGTAHVDVITFYCWWWW